MTDAGLEHTDFLGRAFAEIYGKSGGIGASVGYADVVIKSFAAGRHLLVVIFAAVPCGEAIGPVTGVAES